MAHIFISYCREDKTYVNQLKDALRSYGLEVWLDEQILIGDRWIQSITKALRQCGAMILVMTPDAEQSDWVEKEILLAEEENKRIFPLLLRGKCFLAVNNRHYEDVTNGSLPPERFFAGITTHLAQLKKPRLAKDVMQTQYAICQVNESVPQVISVLLRSKLLVAAVHKENTLVGLISMLDLVTYIASYFGQVLPADTLVSQMMFQEPDLFPLSADTLLDHDLAVYMAERGIQYLPVVDETGRVIGIVNERDVSAATDNKG